MLPEERAKAIVAHFKGRVPPAVESELSDVITRAIHRAMREQLGALELEAMRKAKGAEGRGKSRKGYNPAALHYHEHWAGRFRHLRTGKLPPYPYDITGR